MKKAMMLLATLTLLPWGSLAEAKTLILKAATGEEEKIRVRLSDSKIRKDLEDLGVSLESESDLCNPAGDKHSIKHLEAELELSVLVESLKHSEKPRRLTANQQEMLSRIPLCDPYVTDLVLLAKLKKGYDLIRIEK